MKTIEILKNEHKLLRKRELELEKEIKNIVMINDIEKVSAYNGFNKVYIEIQPKSAWTNVISLHIYKDRFEFKTSSGGWNDNQKALFEFAKISNHLIEKIDEITKLSAELINIDKRKNKVEFEIENLERKLKEEKFLKEHKKVDFKEIEKIIKIEEVFECVNKYNYPQTIEYKNRGYYLNGNKVTVLLPVLIQHN